MTSTELNLPLQPQTFTNSFRVKLGIHASELFSVKRFLGSLQRFGLLKAVFNEEFANRIPARYENKTSKAVFGGK